MSSESSIKTISIDPELFSLPGTKKRKKRLKLQHLNLLHQRETRNVKRIELQNSESHLCKNSK